MCRADLKRSYVVARNIRRKDDATVAASSHFVTPEIAQQVALLADQPSDSVLWSDLYDHLHGGFLAARRLLTTKLAHAPR